MTPEKIFDPFVLAPESMFKLDLVNEPEHGIAVVREHARLAHPKESVSLLLSILSPLLEASDLPIAKPSMIHKMEIAQAVSKRIGN